MARRVAIKRNVDEEAPSFLADSTTSPVFFVTFPLMKPRMLWFCQLTIRCFDPYVTFKSVASFDFRADCVSCVTGHLAEFLDIPKRYALTPPKLIRNLRTSKTEVPPGNERYRKFSNASHSYP